MSLEDNNLSSTSNDCPYPKESPNLSLFPKQLDLLNEDNYSSNGTRILPQAPSINCQTPGWVDHVVNSSASSTTVGQNLNLPLRVTVVESGEAPPPSYEQIMQPSTLNMGTSPFSSNSHLQTDYSRRIIAEQHDSIIENTQIGVDTINLCFGSMMSMFFICVVLFAMYQLLSHR